MVEFKKRVIKAKDTTPITYKRKYTKKTQKSGSLLLKWFIYIVFFGAIVSIILFTILYFKYIKPLPPVDKLETMAIPEASIIYDTEGNELYTFYGEEKRTYVEYENISQNMINAIVAGEDQNFFENKGIDLYRMGGAIVNYLTGKEDSIKGTSTISQQLIRNTLIGSERKIERKIKEIYLSYKMNTKLSKTKILELYLNKISFGSNAYGIEQAAKTFFGKRAQDLNILEASILASLPKGPTYFSPYRHFDRTVGSPYSYNIDTPEEVVNIITQKDRVIHAEQLEVFTNWLAGLKGRRINEKRLLLCGLNTENYKINIKIDSDGCKMFKYSDLLGVLNNFIVTGENTHLEYQTGRKDFILGRMLEENYINFDEYKEALLLAVGFEFKEYKEKITYPHFVFYVKDFLVEKYGQELIEQGGLKIFTSLEPTLQNKAEELISEQIQNNSVAYEAGNAALVTIDNRTGNIVTMVGGGDYYDVENKGNVNIVTSSLQPGSSFKPFVYALAIDKNPIGTKTPVYDVKTTFPGTPTYTPSNFDGKFKGKMTLTSALNQSRNIPAIKMYYLAGGQSNIVEFVNKLGGKSLKAGQYGPSLSLGTGLMTPLDLATSYSTFANLGYKKEISPIKKIEDSKGNIIEETTSETNKGTLVMDSSLAYIMNYMLSDAEERPNYWNKFLTLSDRKVAAKTGTSTFQYEKNGVKYKFPRNLWTAGYTPQYTTVVWSGNTDGKPLNHKGNGLEGAGPVWKKFMDYIHIGEEVQNWSRPEGVQEASISNISGLLPSKSTSSGFLISSLFRNLPNKYDNSFKSVQYDVLCHGEITDKTPEGAIGTGVFIALNSLKPDLPSWENPVQAWGINGGFATIAGVSGVNIITKSIAGPCQTRETYHDSDMKLGTNLKNGSTISPGNNSIEIGYRSSNPIRKVQLFVGNELVETIDTKLRDQGIVRSNFYVPKGGQQNIKLHIKAIDSLYYSKDISITLNIEEDTTSPVISLINPSDGSISLYEKDSFNLRATIEETSNIRSANIYLNGAILVSGLTTKDLVYGINQDGNLKAGEYELIIEVIDESFNKSSKNIQLHVLQADGTKLEDIDISDVNISIDTETEVQDTDNEVISE